MIKLAPALAIACLTALSEIPTAYAACATDDPVAVAKTFYSNHADFCQEDPPKLDHSSRHVFSPHSTESTSVLLRGKFARLKPMFGQMLKTERSESQLNF